MNRVTPPRPVDVEELFPEPAPLWRETVRLHAIGGAGLSLGDVGGVYIFECLTCPDRPHAPPLRLFVRDGGRRPKTAAASHQLASPAYWSRVNDSRTTPPVITHQVPRSIFPFGGRPWRRWRSWRAFIVSWSHTPVAVTSA